MKHLFKTIEEYQKWFPFDSNFRVEDLESDLTLVEDEYIIDALGPSTMANLLTAIDTDTYPNPSTDWQELRDRCRSVAANLTALYHLPVSNVKYTPAGLLVSRTEKAVPASDNRAQDLKLSLQHKSQKLLDSLMRFLRGNTASFTDWANEVQPQFLGTLISDATTFHKHYPIDDNYWVFRKIVPFIKEVERGIIKEHLGAAYLAELKAELSADNLSSDNAEVMKLLQPAVAMLAMEIAIPRLGINLSPRGLILFSNQRGQYDMSLEPSDLKRNKQMTDQALAIGRKRLIDVSEHLNAEASPTKYAAYYNGPAYTDPTKDINDFGNDPEDPDRAAYYTG